MALKFRTREGARRVDAESSPNFSSVEVEREFVTDVYEKLANVYDLVFGPSLQHGRKVALQRMQLGPETRVLEVGIGTGINLDMYPGECHITGIDFSESMLARAQRKVAREQMDNVELFQMDAAALNFPDNSFDVVYAPYLISVVPEPVKVGKEMLRVCRPGGKVMILNHFKSTNRILSRVEKAITPLTVHVGFKSDLDLKGFLSEAGLAPDNIERVNYPRLWTLVTCTKP